MPNYTDMVFFYPWEGPKYKDGLRFTLNGDKIESGNSNDERNQAKGFYKVMVLGKEHYCENREKCEKYIEKNKELHLDKSNSNKYCEMYTNDSNGHKILECGHLPYCREYTKNVINDAINDIWESTSHKNFRKAIDTQKASTLWNYLLFFNFYQRSMPKETNNPHTEQDKSNALKAFVEAVKEHKPDIIITWGDDPFNVIQAQEEIGIKNFKISPKNLKDLSPRLQINQDNYTILFTVLTWTEEESGKEGSCLVVSTGYHPSAPFFHCDEFNKYLRGIWMFYNKLIKWEPIFQKSLIACFIDELNKIQHNIGKRQKTSEQIQKDFNQLRERLKKSLLDNYANLPVAKEIVKSLEDTDNKSGKSIKDFNHAFRERIREIVKFGIQLTWSAKNSIK